MPTEPDETQPKGFLKSIFMQSDIENLNSVSAIEVALRKRARRCRRYSWIFLTGILGGVAAASVVVFQFLGDVTTAQSAVLSEIAEDIEAIQTPIVEELNQLEIGIEAMRSKMYACLTQLGACYAEVRKAGVTDTATLESFGRVLKNGDRLFSFHKNASVATIWMSPDGGSTWQNIGSVDSADRERISVRDNRFVLGDSFGGGYLVLDQLGKNQVEIDDPFDERCPGGGSYFRMKSARDSLYLQARNCHSSTNTELGLIDFREGSALSLPNITDPISHGVFRTLTGGSIAVVGVSDGQLRRLVWNEGEDSWSENDVGSTDGKMISVGEFAFLIEYTRDSSAVKFSFLSSDLSEVTEVDLDLSQTGSAFQDLVARASRESSAFNTREPRWQTALLKDGSAILWLRDEGNSFPHALHVGQDGEGPFARVVADVPLYPGQSFLRFDDNNRSIIKWTDFGVQDPPATPFPDAWSQVPRLYLAAATKAGMLLVEGTTLAGERSVRIWRWQNGGWQTTYLPQRLNVGPIRSWQAFLVGDRLLLAARESQSNFLRFFVSETSLLPNDVLTDEDALVAFLEEASTLKMRVWPDKQELLDRLRRHADLSETSSNIEAALGPITSRLEERGSGSDGPAALVSNFTSEFLFIALARLLILALIFFAVRILINLYRYFLRLSAYYDARADGLALARAPGEGLKERMPENIAEVFGALSPDLVDLGAPVKSPMTEVVDAATKLADAAARAVSSKKSP
ncbi:MULTISPECIES: hypothetical protein [unclassified Ruegeria]|uniref:hypothetical protein n=1 Tax=unclassified Ruegeria TaxID=2625375 RepID=UPI0014910E44|nr:MULTISPECIES: hypothetical protein [unclassified Ruegeria]NOD88232.1 hypothetical protein [Ruegeria sp. HKCCD4318]NOE13141.1 hypothetical protein [Ruegeria sp. HKCCD4318-2]NOG11317.1 hypothetical protein [Ruegeria sp. HKCCD4315]